MRPTNRQARAGACARLGAGVAASLLLAACGSTTRMSGVRIGDETLRQFEPGQTTENWLLAILGPPTTRAAVVGVPSTEVLRYALTEQSGGGLASLLTGRGSRNNAVVYFVVTDGVVTRFWADRQTERTITGRPVEDTSGEKAASALP